MNEEILIELGEVSEETKGVEGEGTEILTNRRQ